MCGGVLRSEAGALAAALALLLLPSSGLVVPVHPDETVVEHGLGAGDGRTGLLVGRVLDEGGLRVTPKHDLGQNEQGFS